RLDIDDGGDRKGRLVDRPLGGAAVVDLVVGGAVSVVHGEPRHDAQGATVGRRGVARVERLSQSGDTVVILQPDDTRVGRRVGRAVVCPTVGDRTDRQIALVDRRRGVGSFGDRVVTRVVAIQLEVAGVR